RQRPQPPIAVLELAQVRLNLLQAVLLRFFVQVRRQCAHSAVRQLSAKVGAATAIIIRAKIRREKKGETERIMQRTAVEQFTSRNLRGVFAPVWLAQSAPGSAPGRPISAPHR